jgi:hypothetical protein
MSILLSSKQRIFPDKYWTISIYSREELIILINRTVKTGNNRTGVRRRETEAKQIVCLFVEKKSCLSSVL